MGAICNNPYKSSSEEVNPMSIGNQPNCLLRCFSGDTPVESVKISANNDNNDKKERSQNDSPELKGLFLRHSTDLINENDLKNSLFSLKSPNEKRTDLELIDEIVTALQENKEKNNELIKAFAHKYAGTCNEEFMKELCDRYYDFIDYPMMKVEDIKFCMSHDYNVNYFFGNYFLSTGEYDESEAAFRKYLESEKLANALREEGKELVCITKQLDQFMFLSFNAKEVKYSILNNFKYHIAYTELGKLALRKNDFDSAQACFNRALKWNHFYLEPLYIMIDLDKISEDYDNLYAKCMQHLYAWIFTYEDLGKFYLYLSYYFYNKKQFHLSAACNLYSNYFVNSQLNRDMLDKLKQEIGFDASVMDADILKKHLKDNGIPIDISEEKMKFLLSISKFKGKNQETSVEVNRILERKLQLDEEENFRFA